MLLNNNKNNDNITPNIETLIRKNSQSYTSLAGLAVEIIIIGYDPGVVIDSGK